MYPEISPAAEIVSPGGSSPAATEITVVSPGSSLLITICIGSIGEPS